MEVGWEDRRWVEVVQAGKGEGIDSHRGCNCDRLGGWNDGVIEEWGGEYYPCRTLLASEGGLVWRT